MLLCASEFPASYLSMLLPVYVILGKNTKPSECGMLSALHICRLATKPDFI